MTDAGQERPAASRSGAGTPRRRPRALPTVFAAAACFAVAFEFLAFQLNAGHDPALGAKATAGVSAPANRKIIVTKVISPNPGPLPAGSSSGSSAAPAPVTTSTS